MLWRRVRRHGPRARERGRVHQAGVGAVRRCPGRRRPRVAVEVADADVRGQDAVVGQRLAIEDCGWVAQHEHVGVEEAYFGVGEGVQLEDAEFRPCVSGALGDEVLGVRIRREEWLDRMED